MSKPCYDFSQIGEAIATAAAEYAKPWQGIADVGQVAVGESNSGQRADWAEQILNILRNNPFMDLICQDAEYQAGLSKAIKIGVRLLGEEPAPRKCSLCGQPVVAGYCRCL